MRWYHPEFGSFITPDPLGFTSGPNYYLLCTGDPVNRTDPTGLSDLEFRALIRIVKAHPTDLAAKRALLTKVLSWGSRAAQAALVAEGMSLNALRAEVAGFRSTAQISSELSAAFRARGVLTVAEADAAAALAAETAVTAESAEAVALTAEALEAAAVTAESAETGALVTEVIVKKGTERAALGGAAGFLGRAGCLAAASTVLEIAGSAYLGYEVGDYLFNKRRIRERKILAEFAEAEALHQRMFAAEYARERRLKLWSDAKQSCTAGAYYLNQAARAEKDRKMFGGSDVSNQDPSVLESFFSTKNEKATSVGSRERQENEYGERFVGPLRPGKRRSGIFSKK